MIRFLVAFFVVLAFNANSAFAQFSSITNLTPITISTNTGEKPQSKVWSYEGKFWTVLPDNNGTHIWRLDGLKWMKVLTLSTNKSSQVDCKVVNDVTHVFLFQGLTSELVSVQYNTSEAKYVLWEERREALRLILNNSVETATIDIDSKGRMWLAYEMSRAIRVRWSDTPYTQWSEEIVLETNVNIDDICAVIAMPGKVGVIWSNQQTQRFGFRTHLDGTDPRDWTADEVPASQSAQYIGSGMADDHLNLAIASDGTLYCAVKTSYDVPDQPLIALLVRRPSGTWDNLYDIASKGTRPIVILNEVEGVVRVIYTEKDGGGDIRYREAEVSTLSFGPQFTLLTGNYNNVTSTKENFAEEIVILASNSTQAVGVLARTEIIPLPVELVSFGVKVVGGNAVLQWKTASEQDNDYFSIETSTDGRTFTSIGKVPGNGTTQLQRHYSFTDENVLRYRSNNIYYRLRQVDFSGEYEFSRIRYVRAPAVPDALVLKAFPSPFKDYFQVHISSNEETVASLSLYDAQGRVLLSRQPHLKTGLNDIVMAGLNLARGIYYLQVSTIDQHKVLKVICE
jgi:hypothetical protein